MIKAESSRAKAKKDSALLKGGSRLFQIFGKMPLDFEKYPK
jgi:hypothetical protein